MRSRDQRPAVRVSSCRTINFRHVSTLVLREQGADQAEHGKDPLREPESLQSLGIDVPDECFTDLLGERASLLVRVDHVEKVEQIGAEAGKG
jgi:hypothetical protein